MTTLAFRRTHKTVVERIRRLGVSEWEVLEILAFEAAVAVERMTAKERVDICLKV